MRKTKIVCTIGPACNNKETLLEMINAGMNVARINMSHGAYDDLENTFNVLKEAIAVFKCAYSYFRTFCIKKN